MSLPENKISTEVPLLPDDLTDEIIDALHSSNSEMKLLQAVLRGPAAAMPRPQYLPIEANDDAILFDEIMK